MLCFLSKHSQYLIQWKNENWFYFTHYQFRYDLPKWYREMQRLHLKIFLYPQIPPLFINKIPQNLKFLVKKHLGHTNWSKESLTETCSVSLLGRGCEYWGVSRVFSALFYTITLSAPRIALQVLLWALLTLHFIFCFFFGRQWISPPLCAALFP